MCGYLVSTNCLSHPYHVVQEMSITITIEDSQCFHDWRSSPAQLLSTSRHSYTFCELCSFTLRSALHCPGPLGRDWTQEAGTHFKSGHFVGIPWWSSCYNAVLPLQGAQVRALVRELRSSMPQGVARKKKKKRLLSERVFPV